MSESSPLGDILEAQRRAWREGRLVRVKDLLLLHPHLAGNREAVLDLVVEEWKLVKERHQELSMARYKAEYPYLADSLEQQFQIIEAVGGFDPSAGSKPASPPLEGPKPSIPGFVTLHELGRGGMGVVYMARQVGLNRLVALKVISSGIDAGKEARSRFQAEAELIASVNHPHIVQIHAFGTEKGLPWFALEYCAGGSLASALGGTPMQAGEAASLLESVARAVHHAHRAGVVHRDLKPANVLLDEAGSPRVTDFGLACRMDGGPTPDGALIGTPPYMAPEQARRDGTVGPLADVYALGAILYECFTGKPPFRGADPLATLKQVIEADPVPPRALNPAVPADLNTICLKCIDKEPASRYASAEALAEDLRRWRSGVPIVARPAGFIEKSWKWAKRRPDLAGAMGAILLLCLIAVGVGAYAVAAVKYGSRLEGVNADLETANEELDVSLQETGRQRSLAEEQRNEALAQRREADRLRQIARRYQYASSMVMLQRYWQEGHQFRVADQLREHVPPQGTEDCRGFEWYYWRERATNLRLHRGHDAEVQAVARSPDGAWFASAGNDKTIRVWDWRGDKALIVLKGHQLPVVGVAFSPDGKRLASCATSPTAYKAEIKVWDAVSGRQSSSISAAAAVFAVAWTPDGQQLITGGKARPSLFGTSGEIHLWNPATGKKERTLSGLAHQVVALTLAPDGRVLASAGATENRAGEIKLWDIATWKVRRGLTAVRGGVWGVAFSPDGKSLASAGVDTTVRLWDVETGKETRAFLGHTFVVKSVAFSPDGKYLASGGFDGTIRSWYAASAKEAAVFRGHAGFVNGLAFDSGGRLLASGGLDKTIRVWDADPGSRPQFVRQVPGDKLHVAFSKDGQRIGCAGGPNSGSGVVRIWDLGSRTPIFDRTIPGAVVLSFTFAPDGNRFAFGTYERGTRTGTVGVWPLEGGAEPLQFRGHRNAVSAVLFDPTGQFVISGSNDKTIRIWDTRKKAAVRTLTGPRHRVFALASSSDGGVLVSTGGEKGQSAGEAIVWDGLDGRRRRALLGISEGVPSVALDPSGRWLGLGSFDEFARVYDLAAGDAPTHQLGHPRIVVAVALSPDGGRLATGCFDGKVRLWDLVTRQELLTLDVAQPALSLAFSPDGSHLASGSIDGTLRVWHRAKDAAAGR